MCTQDQKGLQDGTIADEGFCWYSTRCVLNDTVTYSVCEGFVSVVQCKMFTKDFC